MWHLSPLHICNLQFIKAFFFQYVRDEQAFHKQEVETKIKIWDLDSFVAEPMI